MTRARFVSLSPGSAREALSGFPDWQRDALVRTIAGVSEAGARPAEWPEVRSKGNGDDFTIGGEDTVAGWLACYQEQVGD
ncbi:MAG: hypothetical protein ACRDOK_09890 [Streptosporangiaceae bacterium]